MRLAGPALEQQIRLDAVAIDGRLVAKNLISVRADGVLEALLGQTVEDLPRVLAQLFPLCGTAHAVAALAAIEAALGIEVPPAQRAFRDLMLLAEHGAALGWRILMDWPPLVGRPPEVRSCAHIRHAAESMCAAERGRWVRVGAASLQPDHNALHRAVCELGRMLIDLFPEAADPTLSLRELEAAMERGVSTPARLINAARAGALAEYGRHAQPMLPSMGADWFAARLAAEPRFGDAPTLDGTPAEVGPLGAQRHPLMAEAIAQWGPVLATRLLAAALDAHVVAARLRRALDRLADDGPVDADITRSGRGAGVVETARGPLAYLVDTAEGRVRMLRSVAPTQWNFHPDGPFMAALDAAPKVPNPAFAARLLATSFDPCVPLTIEISADRLPPANAEVGLYA